jgi:four helix bundle protein
MTKPESACGNEDSFWLDGETSVIREEADAAPTYDLEERRPPFGEAVIDFAKTIRQGQTTDRIISQLIGAATSVGANYIEADDSVSKKEFLKCMASARKKHAKQNISCAWRFAQFLRPEARRLWMEAKELHLIFARIWRSGKQKE